jgi:hypothetical protein
VLNSVGTVVLNSSVMDAMGAIPVAEGVLVPTILVSGCCELPSSDSVETSTLKGWVCAHVELWAELRPRRETRAELRRTARRILVNLEAEVKDPVG